MKTLSNALDEYLALRRGMGFKLQDHERVLRKFIVFLHAQETEYITTPLALDWAQQPQHTTQIHKAQRLSKVRGFAQYLSAIDPRTEVPAQGLLPAKPQRAQPYIYTENQIARLIRQAGRLTPSDGLHPHTQSTLLGLLATTGMRIGEAMGLNRSDVDLTEGIITVGQSKFNKSRLIPVHPSTTKKLSSYSQQRDVLVPFSSCESFFLSDKGKRLRYDIIWHAFAEASRQIGLRRPTDRRGPRIHDLRHTFAVRTLVNWYRSGIDPEQRLPLLSAYLGHVKVSDTYWYLSAVPELLGPISTRLDNYLGGLS